MIGPGPAREPLHVGKTMAKNNFFVSYDLHSPGQNYDKVIAE